MEKPFEEEEIKRAVFFLAEDKAPGLDGFSRNYSKIVGKSNLKDLFQEFHTNGKIFLGLNSNFITLIPKKFRC